jgi:hypothetical protein
LEIKPNENSEPTFIITPGDNRAPIVIKAPLAAKPLVKSKQQKPKATKKHYKKQNPLPTKPTTTIKPTPLPNPSTNSTAPTSQSSTPEQKE